MKKEEKYFLELTQTQLLEIMEWHDSHVDKYRKMGVKKNYLKFHEDCNTACYLRDAYGKIRLKDAIRDEYDLHTSR